MKIRPLGLPCFAIPDCVLSPVYSRCYFSGVDFCQNNRPARANWRVSLGLATGDVFSNDNGLFIGFIRLANILSLKMFAEAFTWSGHQSNGMRASCHYDNHTGCHFLASLVISLLSVLHPGFQGNLVKAASFDAYTPPLDSSSLDRGPCFVNMRDFMCRGASGRTRSGVLSTSSYLYKDSPTANLFT